MHPTDERGASRWLIPPIWPLHQGQLQPVDWRTVPRSPEAQRIIAALGRCRSDGASVLLRGSMIEQATPHPAADIDLIVVGSGTLDLRPLAEFGRPVDALRLVPGDPLAPILSTLARTRALPVLGPGLPPRPVVVDREWVLAHWLVYAPFALPRVLRSQGRMRVAQTKQILRCFGLIRLLSQDEFSRDLSTCCRFAAEASPSLGHEATQLKAALDQEPAPPIEIHGLVAWLRHAFYQQLATRFGQDRGSAGAAPQPASASKMTRGWSG